MECPDYSSSLEDWIGYVGAKFITAFAIAVAVIGLIQPWPWRVGVAVFLTFALELLIGWLFCWQVKRWVTQNIEAGERYLSGSRESDVDLGSFQASSSYYIGLTGKYVKPDENLSGLLSRLREVMSLLPEPRVR